MPNSALLIETPPARFAERANAQPEIFERTHDDPLAFWAEQAHDGYAGYARHDEAGTQPVSPRAGGWGCLYTVVLGRPDLSM